MLQTLPTLCAETRAIVRQGHPEVTPCAVDTSNATSPPPGRRASAVAASDRADPDGIRYSVGFS